MASIPFKVGDIIRHKKDLDTCLITNITDKIYGHTVSGGSKGFLIGSPEVIDFDMSDMLDDWELAEESVVDKILTKYNNEDS